jgi:hypothetical protein
VRDGRAWSWGALALAVTFAILSPHPQLLQYLLLVAGAYGLFAAFSASPDGTRVPRATALRRLGLAAVAVGLGFLGSAIQYWPVMEYTSWSPRAGGKDWEHAISYSMPPEELLNTYLPQFTGILDRYWGRNGIHFHSEYIGAAVLALVGLAYARAGGVSRKQVWFWTGVLVVATLWALGGYTPFYSIVYAVVPGTKYFRAPSTMLYVVSFAPPCSRRSAPTRAFGRCGPAAVRVALAGSCGVRRGPRDDGGQSPTWDHAFARTSSRPAWSRYATAVTGRRVAVRSSPCGRSRGARGRSAWAGPSGRRRRARVGRGRADLGRCRVCTGNSSRRRRRRSRPIRSWTTSASRATRDA